MKVYQGNCHYADVTFSLMFEPLEDVDVTLIAIVIPVLGFLSTVRIVESIPKAYLWFYPPKDAVELYGE